MLNDFEFVFFFLVVLFYIYILYPARFMKLDLA